MMVNCYLLALWCCMDRISEKRHDFSCHAIPFYNVYAPYAHASTVLVVLFARKVEYKHFTNLLPLSVPFCSQSNTPPDS
jgi:hypothetical protein